MLKDYLSPAALIILIPILVAQTVLVIFCLADLLRKGSKSLNKYAWIFIMLLFQFAGAITYLFAGKTHSK